MNRLYNYVYTLDNRDVVGKRNNVYVKYHLKTDKRNVTLMCVPTMYAIAKGNRDFFGETYSTLVFESIDKLKEIQHYNISNIPRYRRTMPTILTFLTPDVYRHTMFKDHVLSPFSKSNRKYYRYEISHLLNNRVKIIFKPRLKNTQLVRGWAFADYDTGQLRVVRFEGEFDMMRYSLDVTMGDEGVNSLLPDKCDMIVNFKFMGNKLSAQYTSWFNQPFEIADSIINKHDSRAMDSLRAEPLTTAEAYAYYKVDSARAARDSVKALQALLPPKEEKTGRKLLRVADDIGDKLVSNIKTTLGDKNQGYIRLSPIINPQYLSYSHSRGISYRFDIRTQYDFTPNRNINSRIKLGYRFKLKRFFYQIPINFDYNVRRHARLRLKIGGGDQITNSTVRDEMIGTGRIDTLGMKQDDLGFDKFRDDYIELTNNYDINDYLSIEVGAVYHRRSAIKRKEFEDHGLPTVYKTMAPSLEIALRPWKWTGPVFTLNFETGLKGKAEQDASYQRFEFDAVYKRQMRSLCLLSLRAGAGYYTKRNHTYFLDYKNFHEDNLPGGWNDDWTGDFQLLRSKWYNSSRYYVRANMTYERPFMLAAWIPLVGHYIENERFYINALSVDKLSPYVEYGYGFTNRLFSIGVFASMVKTNFKEVGCRFTFELFNRW